MSRCLACSQENCGRKANCDCSCHADDAVKSEKALRVRVLGTGDFSIGGHVWPGVSKLIEECGEVQQVCGKLLGSSGNVMHFDGSNLEMRLESELGDLLAAIDFVAKHNSLNLHAIRKRQREKLELFEEWHKKRSNR